MTHRSLRTELLLRLALLAAVTLLLVLLIARGRAPGGLDLWTVLLLVFAGVAAIVGAGAAIVSRRVIEPLSRIADSAAAIAAGESEHRVREEGPAEVARVGKALNQLTEQLLQNQHRLAENVRSLDETNQRLTEAQRELVQAEKMASLGHLAAGVAHEIGNPLGAIMGYASLTRRRGGDPELLEGLERETRRIDRIVRDLLDYARPGSALREDVEVNESLERVVKLLRSQGWLERIELELELDLEQDLPPVIGDPHRVDQVFLNLLRNAESAMDGVGTISISTRKEKYMPEQIVPVRRADDPPGVNYSHLRRGRERGGGVEKDLIADAEVIRVVISDTGPGIPEERIASIFDPFFTTKGPGEGTGLGLAIVAGTVADLGGRIEVSSRAGKGATFILWLPTQRRPDE